MAKLVESEEIKNLYNEYASQNIEMPKEYYKLLHKIQKLREDIRKELRRNEIVEKLEELWENSKELSNIDCEQCFIFGYSLGSKLTAESFINVKENTKN